MRLFQLLAIIIAIVACPAIGDVQPNEKNVLTAAADSLSAVVDSNSSDSVSVADEVDEDFDATVNRLPLVASLSLYVSPDYKQRNASTQFLSNYAIRGPPAAR